MEKSNIVKPALIGGVVVGLVYAIPVVGHCFCCLIAMGGGMLATYFYVKESPVVIRSGDGALVGVLSGFIGSVVSTILSIPLSLLFGPAAKRFTKEVLLNIMKGLPNMPPDTLSQLENIPTEYSLGLINIIMSFIFALLIFSIFGTIGGIIGVAVFEKRRGDGPYVAPPTPPPTAPGPTILPPQPPQEPPTTGL